MWQAYFAHLLENVSWIPKYEWLQFICQLVFKVKMMFHEKMASWACNSNNCTNAASTQTSYFVFKVLYMYFQFVTQTIKKTCPWDLIKRKLLLFHQGHPYVEPALASSTKWWQWGAQWSLVPVSVTASVLSTSGFTHLGFCAMSANVHLVKKTMALSY